MPAPAPRERRVRRVASVLLALACLAGAACSASAPPAAPTAAAGSAPATTAAGLAAVAGDPQAGVQGRLLQFRRDVPRRRLEVRLAAANAGLVVEGMELRAPGLTVEPIRYGEPVLARAPGLDLPVTMGTTDCAARPAAPVAVLALRDDRGVRRTVDVPLTDDGLVRRLHDDDCADQALRAQADISVVGVEPVGTPSGPALRVAVELRRIAGSDPLQVTGTGSNTVYDITAVGTLPTLRTGSVVVQVDMVPARCDVHALGESYRTGLIGLVVAVGAGAPRPYTLTPADGVRRRLETFAVTTCRGPTG